MAIWYVDSAASGTNAGTSWVNAYTDLDSAVTSMAAGDYIYMEKGATKTYTTSDKVLNFKGTAAAPSKILSVDKTTGLVTTGAIIATGATNIRLFMQGHFFIQGVKFQIGVGQTGGAKFDFSDGNSYLQFYEDCTFDIQSSGGFYSPIGSFQQTAVVKCKNCTFKYGSTLQDGLLLQGGNFYIEGGSIDAASSIPNRWVVDNFYFSCIGFDLSKIAGSQLFENTRNGQFAYMQDCKLPSSYTLSATLNNGSQTISLVNCRNDAVNNVTELHNDYGDLTTDTGIYLSGGASGGGVSYYSVKLVSKSTLLMTCPFPMTPSVVINYTTGSNITYTFEGLINDSAVPNNTDVWIDAEYLGTASYPLGVYKTSRPNILATPTGLTASTSSWAGPAVRANSTAYTLGQTYTAASNPGRIFFCTTAGTTAGSEPGGITSATDGSTPVTDGSAAFRAGCRFKVTVTLTSPVVQYAGPLTVTPVVGKASASIWIDPKPTAS